MKLFGRHHNHCCLYGMGFTGNLASQAFNIDIIILHFIQCNKIKQLDVVVSPPANWFDCYKPYGFLFIWEIVIVPVDRRLQ